MKFIENLTQKQKQQIYLGVVIVIVIGGLFLLSYLMGNKAGGEKQKFQPKKKMSLLTEKVEKDLWVAAEGQNIKALEKSNDELRSQIDQLRKEVKEAKEETKAKDAEEKKEAEKAKLGVPPVPSGKLPKNAQPAMNAPLPTLGERSTQAGSEGTVIQPVKQQQHQLPGMGNAPGAQSQQPTIRMFKEEGSGKPEKKELNKKKQEKGVWLPAGSFMKAVMLNGIDAPTSSSAQNEPYPVLLTITDMSNLPNRFKMNLKECFIIGAGYGNLSDERAYIRTETLSCVTTEGKSIDVALKGQVVGGDGKLGVRGRLVSKQGQKIAMAIFAGTIGGLGNALKPQQSLSLNLNGTSSTSTVYPNAGDVALSAGMGGTGTALNKVADYYLKMAETLFPIIEIDAGRPVEVIILKGQELAIQGKKN